MKFSFFTQMLVVVCSVSLAFGQGGQRRRRSVEERVAGLTTQLDLSGKQAKKITTIMEKQRKEFQELREEFEGDREGMRGKSRELRERYDEEIKKVLNKDQLKKYEEMQAERRARREARRRDGGGGERHGQGSNAEAGKTDSDSTNAAKGESGQAEGDDAKPADENKE